MGCRPFVWRVATSLRLSGWVQNDSQGVTIEVQGEPELIDRLVEILKDASRLPPLMQISSIRSQPIDVLSDENGFVIRHSESDDAAEITEVSVDTAVCGDCIREMKDPQDFRHRYPFINCTNCGPRYSIIRTVPYDRANTTMAAFAMCPRCGGQYGNPADRRFHAQPVACPACGPKIWLCDPQGKTIESDGDKVIATAARMLREGRIVAIKGIGGFHLAVDAFNEPAVQRLRQRKQRDDKPFAMMAASLEVIERICGGGCGGAIVAEQSAGADCVAGSKAKRGPADCAVGCDGNADAGLDALLRTVASFAFCRGGNRVAGDDQRQSCRRAADL